MDSPDSIEDTNGSEDYSSYRNNVSKSNHPHYDHYMYDTKYSWNKYINRFILFYFFPYKKSNNGNFEKKEKH
ncbi:unnamed protein product, partial [Vitis vinifera]|uniref:Uncharacterized protein n=1 Tax=Vitis vinifera TaxID=29760 RepID=D7SZV7_VITVI